MSDAVPSPTRVTIDLGALVANWRALAAQSRTETAGVLKADAYGIGLEQAGAALAKAGCRTFFVATPEEGVRLRRAAPNAIIYVLSGIFPGSLDALIAHDLRPVLNSLADIDDWTKARAQGATNGSAIHVDTGMNRLGITPAEAHKIDVARIAPSLVMTHLVISEEPDHPLNRKQLDAFLHARAAMPGIPASLSNSAGIYLGPEYQFDLARPGIALYGASPGPKSGAPMNVVVTAEARVLLIREGQTGETVGYGATRRLTRPTRIAILAAGYADGYRRITPGNDAYVFVRGKKAPLLGRVSMDLIAADVTDIPDAQRGDWAELFGRNVPVDHVAAQAGTVSHELLTNLGKRYARIYVGG